jgi:hypothetical protein
MQSLAFQEHVIDASWMSIHGSAVSNVDDPFFANNKSAQHVKKIRLMRTLFRGDLEPVLGVDFSHPSSQGAERESRLRRWAEEFWNMAHENSLGMIFDRDTKRTRDVLDEVCEMHGGHKSSWVTRFGFFNTFRAPGPARQGLSVQDEDHGKPFLKMQAQWKKQEALLREAEEQSRRLIEDERKRAEAAARAAEAAARAAEAVAPVVGQPVAAVVEEVATKPIEETVKTMNVQEIDEDDEDDEDEAPPADEAALRASSPNAGFADVAEERTPSAPLPDPDMDEEGWTSAPLPSFPKVRVPTPEPPAPPRGPSPNSMPAPVHPPLISLPKSVPEAAAEEVIYGADTIKNVKILWTKAQALGKKRELQYDTAGVCEPFQYHGWVIRTHKRGLTKSGTEPTTLCDSYFIAPSGKRFRSAKELERAYC